MPVITVEVTGSRKLLGGLIEDHTATQIPLDFLNDTATPTVAGGGFADLSIWFVGSPGEALKLVVKKGQKTLETRNYKIDPDGTGGRALQFDPDA